MTLPRFLGLGALKAGTTTVHTLLAHHPQIALPTHRKEVMFFDRSWERGPAWYEAHFDHAGGRTPGEISPNYLFDPAVPGRIAGLIPDARLFAVLREPVSRAFSQYVHFVREQRYRQPFETFLGEHPNAFERGLYAPQLRRFLDHFPREQLHVLHLEALIADPAPVTAALLAHLGVPVIPLPPPERQNAGVVPAASRTWAAGRKVARWLYDHDLAWVVDKARALGVRERLLRRTGDKPAKMSDATRARLTEAYAADQEDLRSLSLR